MSEAYTDDASVGVVEQTAPDEAETVETVYSTADASGAKATADAKAKARPELSARSNFIARL